MRRQAVDDGASGIGEAEQLGDLIVGFAGGIVSGLTEQGVPEVLIHAKQVGVAAARHQRQRGQFHRRAGAARFQNHGVDVAFNMVDRDQRQAAGEGQRFGIGEAHQQGSHQAGPRGGGNGVQAAQRNRGPLQRFTHHGNDGAQVLARSQFRHYAAILAVGVHLRRHHR